MLSGNMCLIATQDSDKFNRHVLHECALWWTLPGLNSLSSCSPRPTIRTGVLNLNLPPLGQLYQTRFRENPPVDTAGPSCARRRTAPTLAGWERSRARPLAAPEPNARRSIERSTLGVFSSEMLKQSRWAPLRIQQRGGVAKRLVARHLKTNDTDPYSECSQCM